MHNAKYLERHGVTPDMSSTARDKACSPSRLKQLTKLKRPKERNSEKERHKLRTLKEEYETIYTPRALFPPKHDVVIKYIFQQ